MSQIEPLSQPPFDADALQLIQHFKDEYHKYKAQDPTNLISKWLNSKNVDNHGIWKMKNDDIVIASRSGTHSSINGEAIVYYKNKSLYIGNLLNTQRSGVGYRSFKKSKLVYHGEYANDLKSGNGRLYSIDGKKWVFEGHYANDLRNGHGHLQKLDRNVYLGNYVNDKMNGNGIMTWGNKNQYEGDFKNDLKHGSGKMHWNNGDHYEGEFQNNILQGKGTYTWKNGETYTGEFVRNKTSGQGIMDYSSVINIKGSAIDAESFRNLQFNVITEDDLYRQE